MYDMLASQFSDAMTRGGKTITSSNGNTSYKCLFRKNSDKNQTHDRVTIFYWATEDIAQGQILKFKNTYYIVLNQETVENDVYKKSDLLKANTQIHTISDGYELYVKAYAQDMTSVGVTGDSTISTVGGNISFIASDNADTKRLAIDSKFTALGGTWKIINLYYITGLCHIYVERVANSSTTPTYGLSVTAGDSYKIDDTGIATTTATITDGSATTTILNPTITWSSSDDSIATITDDGTITGISEGAVTITATWVEHGITATKEITIKSNVVLTYTASIEGRDELRTGTGYTYTAHTGATASLTPVWSLTLKDGIPSDSATLTPCEPPDVRVHIKDEDSIAGSYCTLHLTDSDNLCSADMDIWFI